MVLLEQIENWNKNPEIKKSWKQCKRLKLEEFL